MLVEDFRDHPIDPGLVRQEIAGRRGLPPHLDHALHHDADLGLVEDAVAVRVEDLEAD